MAGWKVQGKGDAGAGRVAHALGRAEVIMRLKPVLLQLMDVWLSDKGLSMGLCARALLHQPHGWRSGATDWRFGAADCARGSAATPKHGLFVIKLYIQVKAVSMYHIRSSRHLVRRGRHQGWQDGELMELGVAVRLKLPRRAGCEKSHGSLRSAPVGEVC